MEVFGQNGLAAIFAEHRERLLAVARRRLNPVLLKRMSPEDVVSEAYANAARRLDFFANRDDVPVYFKLRTMLVQTISDIERRNLQARARDAYMEAEDPEGAAAEVVDDITSPASRVDRAERHALLRAALASLPGNDRTMLEMRHFDGMGNSECAAALGISEKAASQRYARALERLQKKLMEVSCFRKS